MSEGVVSLCIAAVEDSSSHVGSVFRYDCTTPGNLAAADTRR